MKSINRNSVNQTNSKQTNVHVICAKQVIALEHLKFTSTLKVVQVVKGCHNIYNITAILKHRGISELAKHIQVPTKEDESDLESFRAFNETEIIAQPVLSHLN